MKKVFVGLSGGVDSAVSAALLQELGHDVTGVFIKIWSPEFLECTWRDDRLDAMRVAVHLGIPFREIDLSKEYRDAVVENMIESYKKGVTPNPDVLCNEIIKFGAFKKWALENGADAIATGHYARIEKAGDTHRLLKGVDPAKDQSYFLYRLRPEDLATTLFPVGKYTKSEIRAKAAALGLPNAERPDSQGLCFVGDVSLPEFLGRFITSEKGKLMDEDGNILGQHDGAAFYTVGQRHGFHLLPEAPAGPYYVISINANKNEVLVSKNKSKTERTKTAVRDIHWIGESEKVLNAVPRYHAKPTRAHLINSTVDFEEPLQLTPGQSLVFYSGEVCLGGAVIAE